MTLTTILTAIAVFSVVAIASGRSPRIGDSPHRGRQLLKWLGMTCGSAALVAFTLQKLIPVLAGRYGGEFFEWAIFLGTLIGGVALVVVLTGSLSRNESRREIGLLIAQVLGVWVVCIGTLMQIHS